MKKVFGILLGLGFVALVVVTALFLYRKSQTKPVVYQTASPSYADIVRKAVATGSVVPREEVAIKPLVSGIVDELYVEAGEVVEKGKLLAKVRVIPGMSQLSDGESRLNRARISLADAEREHGRQKSLFEQGTTARADLDRAEVALAQAREEVAAAQSALDIVRSGTSERVARSATTMVPATIAGMVLDVPVKEGNSVIQANNFNEGTTIASIADMTDMIFEGKVDESEVGKIRPGMELVLTVGALPEERIGATLEYIAPKGVEENGAIQFEIRAAVEGVREGLLLRANYSANADIVLDKREGVLAIDEGLLQWDGEQAFVEIETGPQQFERRDLTLGLSDGIQIEVVSGLAEGDKIKNPNTDLAAGGPAPAGATTAGAANRRGRRAT
ncbi:MAG: efflux RND transporter periplasmic adaptor subunit [Thermoanaerobaculia bacterium]|nr:efflux RND transporter periplasmic adaptor subunit [Thermoanaerobaculia bacterium]